MTGELDLPLLRRERLARLRQALRDADVAGGLFLDPINIRYATDVSNMQVWCLHNPTRYAFVATEGRVTLFEFASCEHLGRNAETVDDVRPAISWTHLMAGPGTADAAAAFAREVADLVAECGGGNRRVAVDRLDVLGYRALTAQGIEVIEGQPVAEHARVVKTGQELAAMRDAMTACETAVTAMRAACEPGRTEREVWSVLHQQNIALGGEWIETRLLTSGHRTNPWYQECSDWVIRDGDLIALDTDLIGRHGYCCDISRTWRAGEAKANDGQRRTYGRAFSHLQRLLDLLGPGVTLAELADRIGDPPADDHVYSCLVHGIGLCDEYPVGFWRSTPGRYDAVLAPGMTLCVESYLGPGDGAEGVKLEEQVLITETGIEKLSSLPFETDWL